MDIIKKNSTARELTFIGNSQEMIAEFPQAVKKKVGYALRFVQWGLKHEHAKPFKGLGIKTPQKEIDLIKARLKIAKEIDDEA